MGEEKMMKVTEQNTVIRKNKTCSIKDGDNLWFIDIELLDGKFVKMREMMNQPYLDSLGIKYRHKVYELAYKTLMKDEAHSGLYVV